MFVMNKKTGKTKCEGKSVSNVCEDSSCGNNYMKPRQDIYTAW